MGAQWTNKYAILRDLSFAQGRKVPGELVGSIGSGDKPPAINIVEETEEEYFKSYVGDSELHTKPDLSMIKQLLDEVRAEEIDIDDINHASSEKVLEVSKLNPLSKEFVPLLSGAGDTINEGIGKNDNVKSADEIKTENLKVNLPKKKRYERNVAMLSLLEMEESSSGVENSSDHIDRKVDATNKSENIEVKLLKPNDFISDKTVTEAVDKVTEWLQTPAKCLSPKAEPIALPATSMFKRKKQVTPVLETTSMFKRKSDTSSTRSCDSDKQVNDTIVQSSSNESNNLFVPSAHANEYYKKFVERSKMQQSVTEDLWERAQREMKEIDAKKLKEKQQQQQEAELNQLLTTTEDQPNVNTEGATPRSEIFPQLLSDIRGLEFVRLPLHRHELPQECLVCLVLCKPSQTS